MSTVLEAMHKTHGKIVVYCDYPPIPIRQFDYCAILDDEQGEESQRQGHGETAEDALAALLIELED